ncbi:MAG: flavin reductase [Haliea sp.]|nr:flavin reductase [Haliea sp.]MAL94246.1 flavin reductase [Haliea sp.]|tara:strand:- start:1607 stop:2080 length:474 start_codon:yes stop_codon:yes gene_type:complete
MQLDGRELRNALGRFATGVCLITTVNEEGEALALTANSFSSVSLDPPLVLWSLQNNSDVYHIYSGAKRYAINVLSDGQQELSNRYARKGDHGLEAGHYRMGDSGAPIIEGALLSLECSLEAAHPGGDHIILVGRVEGVHLAEGDPLLFYGGAYRALA